MSARASLRRCHPKPQARINRFTRSAFALVVWLALATSALAESMKPLREARSDNRRFTLTIGSSHADDTDAKSGDESKPESQPANSPPEQPANAHASDGEPDSQPASTRTDGAWATLHRVERGRDGADLWRGRLVNKVAPVHACISDDGQFTITLDDYPVGGARHAVVVYNEKGELLREFSLRELLRKDDWKEVRQRRGAIYWLRGAKMKFSRDGTQFRIDLRSDRRIVIDLRKLEIEGGSADADDVPPEFAAMLDQPPQVADVSTPQNLDDALDHLRIVVGTLGEGATQDDLDEAHAVVEMLLARLMAEEPPNEEAIQQALAALASPEIAAHFPSEDLLNVEGDPQVADGGSFAGNSAGAGVAVPQPNPKDRVDYVSWMREQTGVEGESAAPIVAEAVSKLTKWEGDIDLRDRAMNGDIAALQSPEIQTWLAANQSAIELAWKAIELPYRGVQPQDGADSLIGILLPDLGARREITRAAIVRGRTLEAAGDVAGARREYLNATRFGAQTGQGATLIENLVGAAIQIPSSNALLDSLEDDRATDFAALAGELEQQYRPVRSIAEVMQFERAMLLETLQKTYSVDADSGELTIGGEGLQTLAEVGGMAGGSNDVAEQLFTAQRMMDISFEGMVGEANSFYDQFTEAAQLPYPEAQQRFGEIERSVADPALAQRNPFVATMLPALSRVNQLSTRAESQRRATLLVANLKAYKQQHGTYPPSLDVFAEREWASDPFTGQPYRYQPGEGNFRLYSVGINGSDDGGVHDPGGRESDTVFWPRPKP